MYVRCHCCCCSCWPAIILFPCFHFTLSTCSQPLPRGRSLSLSRSLSASPITQLFCSLVRSYRRRRHRSCRCHYCCCWYYRVPGNLSFGSRVTFVITIIKVSTLSAIRRVTSMFRVFGNGHRMRPHNTTHTLTHFFHSICGFLPLLQHPHRL